MSMVMSLLSFTFEFSERLFDPLHFHQLHAYFIHDKGQIRFKREGLHYGVAADGKSSERIKKADTLKGYLLFW